MQEHQVLTALRLAQVLDYSGVATATDERREGFLRKLVGRDQVEASCSVGTGGVKIPELNR